MKQVLVAFILFLCSFTIFSQKTNFIQYVNPLIGTQRMGHTYPGATVPFGSVQLSPDTDTIPYEANGKYNGDVYKYCAGYQYDDPTIVGFSHTHFTGTGHSDLGDFLIMPTTGLVQLNPGIATQPKSGYRSTFSHNNETSQPNYYKVKLEDDNIWAELTTTTHVGFHQYTFPQTEQANIILDLMHGIYNYEDKTVWTYLRMENDTLVTGYRQTNGWARTRTVYFAMSFSKAVVEYGNKEFSKKQAYRGFWGKFNQSKNFPEFAGKQLRAWFSFGHLQNGEQIKIKFAMSPVSTKNALKNLQQEIPGWDFNAIKNQGQKEWENELGKVKIDALSNEEKINFYTSLYHCFLSPTVYGDVNGEYKGLDQNIHKANSFTNYTTFSLWDTYRALHPLLNIIQPKRNAHMIQSMLAHQEQSAEHMLPIWSHYANENWCMSGYHAVSVIADAAIKGLPGFDLNKALNACVTTARTSYFMKLGDYLTYKYIPEDKLPGISVSTTLEFAYDDWCIAQLAKKLNRKDLYNEFISRSQYWINVFDPLTGYMRPRLSDGSFRKNFDVLSTHNQGFIEGNAWNYSLYVPHDPQKMISLMGGNEKFIPHLDSLFTMNLPDEFFRETEDITRDGIIGNYVHGNEPSHHVAYLYNFTNQPWKTQERVRMILQKQYKATPDGLGGNDDCGQMSAWFILSSLGFYPVTPGSQDYQLGSPSIKKAVIELDNGKKFTIIATNQSPKNVYTKNIYLNGKKIIGTSFTHAQLMKGGTLMFEMSSTPSL